MNRHSLGRQKALEELCERKDEENAQLRARIAQLELQCNKFELRAEDADIFEMWLDDRNAPKHRNDLELSLVGRTIDLIKKSKAEAIREARRSIIDSWCNTVDHVSVMCDDRYVYISNMALDEYADNLERGES